MSDEPQVFHVGVSHPTELRRDILLTQKDIVSNLKKYEHVLNIRAEKEMRIAELKKMLTTLKTTVGKINKALPANKVVGMKKSVPVPQKTLPAPVKKPAMPKPKSEMDKLEDELSMIESRLANLD
jgi:phosphoenolpyruvate carboxylase